MTRVDEDFCRGTEPEITPRPQPSPTTRLPSLVSDVRSPPSILTDFHPLPNVKSFCRFFESDTNLRGGGRVDTLLGKSQISHPSTQGREPERYSEPPSPDYGPQDRSVTRLCLVFSSRKKMRPVCIRVFVRVSVQGTGRRGGSDRRRPTSPTSPSHTSGR